MGCFQNNEPRECGVLYFVSNLILHDFSYFCDMNNMSYHTSVVKVGNAKGIRIPEDYLETLGTDVVLEKTKDGILIRSANEVAPLEDWDKLFLASDTASDAEFQEWDITLQDGIA